MPGRSQGISGRRHVFFVCGSNCSLGEAVGVVLWFPSFPGCSSLQPQNHCQPSEGERNIGQPTVSFFNDRQWLGFLETGQAAELCLEFPNIGFAEMWAGSYAATNQSSALGLASVLEPQKWFALPVDSFCLTSMSPGRTSTLPSS